MPADPPIVPREFSQRDPLPRFGGFWPDQLLLLPRSTRNEPPCIKLAPNTGMVLLPKPPRLQLLPERSCLLFVLLLLALHGAGLELQNQVFAGSQ